VCRGVAESSASDLAVLRPGPVLQGVAVGGLGRLGDVEEVGPALPVAGLAVHELRVLRHLGVEVLGVGAALFPRADHGRHFFAGGLGGHLHWWGPQSRCVMSSKLLLG
jgi:hypothetical protein